MNWSNIEIFCILPHDRTTFFLERVVNFLKRNLGEKFHCYKVKLNNESHENCLKTIEGLSDKFIIFLGHGRSDMLFGASGDYAENMLIASRSIDGPDFFNRPNFINIENIKNFKSNTVFSLSCNSNEKKKSIGFYAIKNGVYSFVGFGDIQTDYEIGKEMTNRQVGYFKGILVKIIKISLLYSIKNNYTVERLTDTIKILTNKEIYFLLSGKHKDRYIISKQLFLLKDQMVTFGDEYTQLYNSTEERR